jgi:hypothetical protein
MTFLLTAHFADLFRGTERFNYILAKYLSNEGHDVYFFSHKHGGFSKSIAEYATILEEPGIMEFDQIISSHNVCYKDVMHLSKNRLFICHGILSNLDVPPGDCPSVAVSEEAMIEYGCDGVMKNPVDMDFFYPEEKRGDTIVYLDSNPTEIMLKILEKNNENYEVVGAGGKDEDISKKVRSARMVIAGARGALEAMACKVPVLVYKSTGFDGYCGEYWELQKNNFSGRRYSKDLTLDTFRYEMAKINDEDTEDCYEYVKDQHDIKSIMYRLRQYL